MRETPVVHKVYYDDLFVAPRIKVFEPIRPQELPKAIRQAGALFLICLGIHSDREYGLMPLQYKESTVLRNFSSCRLAGDDRILSRSFG